jgi:uncharacterized protein YggU (UPF0235/DUF167 family)
MTMIPLQEKNGHTYLTVKVTPRGSANKIQALETDLFGDTILKIMVTAIPDKGEANQAVVELIAKTFRLPKRAITIVAGKTSRIKIVTIEESAVNVWKKLQEIENVRVPS